MKKFKRDETLLRRPPLYQQAVEALRGRLVRDMAPGECLPSEHLLAGEYGVGLATIREALRILASEGRVVRKQGKGTFVAIPREKDIAITIAQDISDPRTSSIYLRIAQEVRGLLEREGLSSRLYIGRNPPEETPTGFLCPEFFQDLEADKIQGVIGVLLYGKAAWLGSLEEKGIRLAGFGKDKPCGAFEDTRGFFAAAVDELARRGRRRLALLTWQGFDNCRADNSEMFEEVLTAAGLPVVKPWIKDDINMILDGAGWEAFREVWSALPERPDGLVIADDFFLGGALSAMSEMGLSTSDQIEVAVRLSHHPAPHSPRPLIAWQSDVPAIARALVEAELAILRNESPAPPLRSVPVQRALEREAPRTLQPAGKRDQVWS